MSSSPIIVNMVDVPPVIPPAPREKRSQVLKRAGGGSVEGWFLKEQCLCCMSNLARA